MHDRRPVGSLFFQPHRHSWGSNLRRKLCQAIHILRTLQGMSRHVIRKTLATRPQPGVRDLKEDSSRLGQWKNIFRALVKSNGSRKKGSEAPSQSQDGGRIKSTNQSYQDGSHDRRTFNISCTKKNMFKRSFLVTWGMSNCVFNIS